MRRHSSRYARLAPSRTSTLPLEPAAPAGRCAWQQAAAAVIRARVNRDTGAASITAASAAQLERGNALLEREAARRRWSRMVPDAGAARAA
jgi:hypothetical protein